MKTFNFFDVIKSPDTMLLIEGEAYRLVRYKRAFVGDVCFQCDLMKICHRANQCYSLMVLCSGDPHYTGWFFKRDYDFEHDLESYELKHYLVKSYEESI